MSIPASIIKSYDIRGRFPEEFDATIARSLGYGFAKAFKLHKVVVARDNRSESTEALAAFCEGLTAAGCTISDLGIASTPELLFAVGAKKFDGGVMATASHNPQGYAGFKLVDGKGNGLGRETGLKKIVARAKIVAPTKVSRKPLSIKADYYRLVTSLINLKSLVGMSVALDARHGSAAQSIDHVFSRLPLKKTLINADTKLQSPHGYNPLEHANHPQLTRVIKKTKSDLGLMWDGDGDRCVFFDERGKFVEPYYINCLLADIMLQKYPKATIAIDSRMPVGLSTIITNHKGTPQVISPGWSLIIRAMTKSKALFGCEHSAHFFIDIAKLSKQRRQQVVADTIIVPLMVISYLKEHTLTLSEAVASYQEQFVISGELNFEHIDTKKVLTAIRRKYARKKIIATDGISVFGGQWFFNVRPSNTEPLVRLNIEATDKAHVASLRLELEQVIKKFQS